MNNKTEQILIKVLFDTNSTKNKYIVSDWFGELFLISPDSTKQSLLKTSELKIYAADIDYIAAKKLLLVPTFFDNRIMAYTLE